ncbi:23 kDa integral membrane protein-like [Toxorhynchites rutilus septentrionalis]|uniref:23 kDa integral membrane protein-like n=1 Tax=Toxorhynchites rutilus septentrionalis TaxID=329112 RepID=UPI00247AE723|nr:23 kDa integral membrane protein-like [Toxorhynchites rutilus septentrionalis]
MALSITLSTVKFCLLVFNLFCFIFGLALAVVGGVWRYKIDSVNNLAERDTLLTSESLLALTVGCIIFTVAFFGFCGVIKQSSDMLTLYGALLIVLIVLQVVMVVMLFVSVDSAEVYLLRWFKDYYDAHLQLATRGDFVDPRLDRLQTAYECCGKHSFVEWGNRLPQSCCKEGLIPDCKPYERGCRDALEEYVRHTGTTVAWALVCLIGMEFVALVLACCLASGIKHEFSRVNLG